MKIFFSQLTALYPKLIALTTTACFLLTAVCGQAAAVVSSDVRERAAFAPVLAPAVVPTSRGRIVGGNALDRDTVVVTIQDLHCHPEVQRNISAIIAGLAERYPVSRIYIEGAAAGPVDMRFARCIPDDALRKKVLDSLMEKGELTGAEYVAGDPAWKPGLFGLEDRELYTRNSLRLGEIKAARPKIDAAIAQARKRLDAVKRDYFNARQKKLETSIQRYRAGKLKDRKFYLLLSKHAGEQGLDINEYQNIARYLSLVRTEKKFDYGHLRVQLSSFLTDIKQRLPYHVYASILGQTENFTNLPELYRILARLSEAKNADFSARYPALRAFFSYVSASRDINPSLLLHEENRLIEDLHLNFAKNQSEREVVFLARHLRLLEDYLCNRISAPDYAEFSQAYDQFASLYRCYTNDDAFERLAELIATLRSFYQDNLTRNEYFVRNMIDGNGSVAPATVTAPTGCSPDQAAAVLTNARTVIVAVTGGFHAAGLAQLLDARGVSHIDIMPNVTEDTVFADKLYDEKLREQNRILSQTFMVMELAAQPYDKALPITIGEIIAIRLREGIPMPQIEADIKKYVTDWNRDAQKTDTSGQEPFAAVHVTLEEHDTRGNFAFVISKGEQAHRYAYNAASGTTVRVDDGSGSPAVAKNIPSKTRIAKGVALFLVLLAAIKSSFRSAPQVPDTEAPDSENQSVIIPQQSIQLKDLAKVTREMLAAYNPLCKGMPVLNLFGDIDETARKDLALQVEEGVLPVGAAISRKGRNVSINGLQKLMTISFEYKIDGKSTQIEFDVVMETIAHQTGKAVMLYYTFKDPLLEEKLYSSDGSDPDTDRGTDCVLLPLAVRATVADLDHESLKDFVVVENRIDRTVFKREYFTAPAAFRSVLEAKGITEHTIDTLSVEQIVPIIQSIIKPEGRGGAPNKDAIALLRGAFPETFWRSWLQYTELHEVLSKALGVPPQRIKFAQLRITGPEGALAANMNEGYKHRRKEHYKVIHSIPCLATTDWVYSLNDTVHRRFNVRAGVTVTAERFLNRFVSSYANRLPFPFILPAVVPRADLSAYNRYLKGMLSLSFIASPEQIRREELVAEAVSGALPVATTLLYDAVPGHMEQYIKEHNLQPFSACNTISFKYRRKMITLDVLAEVITAPEGKGLILYFADTRHEIPWLFPQRWVSNPSFSKQFSRQMWNKAVASVALTRANRIFLDQFNLHNNSKKIWQSFETMTEKKLNQYKIGAIKIYDPACMLMANYDKALNPPFAISMEEILNGAPILCSRYEEAEDYVLPDFVCKELDIKAPCRDKLLSYRDFVANYAAQQVASIASGNKQSPASARELFAVKLKDPGGLSAAMSAWNDRAQMSVYNSLLLAGIVLVAMGIITVTDAVAVGVGHLALGGLITGLARNGTLPKKEPEAPNVSDDSGVGNVSEISDDTLRKFLLTYKKNRKAVHLTVFDHSLPVYADLVRERIAAMAGDELLSLGITLDILPKGVSVEEFANDNRYTSYAAYQKENNNKIALFEINVANARRELENSDNPVAKSIRKRIPRLETMEIDDLCSVLNNYLKEAVRSGVTSKASKQMLKAALPKTFTHTDLTIRYRGNDISFNVLVEDIPAAKGPENAVVSKRGLIFHLVIPSNSNVDRSGCPERPNNSFGDATTYAYLWDAAIDRQIFTLAVRALVSDIKNNNRTELKKEIARTTGISDVDFKNIDMTLVGDSALLLGNPREANRFMSLSNIENDWKKMALRFCAKTVTVFPREICAQLGIRPGVRFGGPYPQQVLPDPSNSLYPATVQTEFQQLVKDDLRRQMHWKAATDNNAPVSTNESQHKIAGLTWQELNALPHQDATSVHVNLYGRFSEDIRQELLRQGEKTFGVTFLSDSAQLPSYIPKGGLIDFEKNLMVMHRDKRILCNVMVENNANPAPVFYVVPAERQKVDRSNAPATEEEINIFNTIIDTELMLLAAHALLSKGITRAVFNAPLSNKLQKFKLLRNDKSIIGNRLEYLKLYDTKSLLFLHLPDLNKDLRFAYLAHTAIVAAADTEFVIPSSVHQVLHYSWSRPKESYDIRKYWVSDSKELKENPKTGYHLPATAGKYRPVAILLVLAGFLVTGISLLGIFHEPVSAGILLSEQLYLAAVVWQGKVRPASLPALVPTDTTGSESGTENKSGRELVPASEEVPQEKAELFASLRKIEPEDSDEPGITLLDRETLDDGRAFIKDQILQGRKEIGIVFDELPEDTDLWAYARENNFLFPKALPHSVDKYAWVPYTLAEFNFSAPDSASVNTPISRAVAEIRRSIDTCGVVKLFNGFQNNSKLYLLPEVEASQDEAYTAYLNELRQAQVENKLGRKTKDRAATRALLERIFYGLLDMADLVFEYRGSSVRLYVLLEEVRIDEKTTYILHLIDANNTINRTFPTDVPETRQAELLPAWTASIDSQVFMLAVRKLIADIWRTDNPLSIVEQNMGSKKVYKRPTVMRVFGKLSIGILNPSLFSGKKIKAVFDALAKTKFTVVMPSDITVPYVIRSWLNMRGGMYHRDDMTLFKSLRGASRKNVLLQALCQSQRLWRLVHLKSRNLIRGRPMRSNCLRIPYCMLLILGHILKRI